MPVWVELLHVLVRLFGRPAVLIVLVQEHLKGVRMPGKTLVPDNTKECRTIRAVVEPVLLLPATKARCPSGNLLRHLHGHVSRDPEPNVSELSGPVLNRQRGRGSAI